MMVKFSPKNSTKSHIKVNDDFSNSGNKKIVMGIVITSLIFIVAIALTVKIYSAGRCTRITSTRLSISSRGYRSKGRCAIY